MRESSSTALKSPSFYGFLGVRGQILRGEWERFEEDSIQE